MSDTRIAEELQVVKAVIVDPRGRYLMQLRDDIPDIAYPGYWSLFGGAAEPGETYEAGVLRELEEELRFRPEMVSEIMRFEYTIPQHGVRIRRVAAFAARITPEQIAGLELHEGAAMEFLSVDELSAMANVVPWGLCMVQMHASVLPYPHLLASRRSD